MNDTNSAAILKWLSRTASHPIITPVSSQTITFTLIIDATRCGKTPGALHEIFSFTAQGRSTHARCWSRRCRPQSREPAAGHTSTGLRRSQVLLKSGADLRNAMSCCPCPPGCNPVSTMHSTRIEHASMFGNTHSGGSLFVRTVVLAIPPSMACPWRIRQSNSNGHLENTMTVRCPSEVR
jgi:hypothetical protein